MINEPDIWGRDTLVQVYESLYGDKCIVWQMNVIDDEKRGTDESFATVTGIVTETNYAMNQKSVSTSPDFSVALNANIIDIPETVLDELVNSVVGVEKENIIGYDD